MPIELVAKDQWDLPPSLTVHGVTIADYALSSDVPVPGTSPRTLRLASPYLRGEDVRAVQQALVKNGLSLAADGVYGLFSDAIVKAWQASKPMMEDGVGAATRQSLGIP